MDIILRLKLAASDALQLLFPSNKSVHSAATPLVMWLDTTKVHRFGCLGWCA